MNEGVKLLEIFSENSCFLCFWAIMLMFFGYSPPGPPFEPKGLLRAKIKLFLEDVIRGAVAHTEQDKRKTVTAMDVVEALKKQSLREGHKFFWVSIT